MRSIIIWYSWWWAGVAKGEENFCCLSNKKKTSACDIQTRENVHASYNNKQDDQDDASDVKNLFDFFV